RQRADDVVVLFLVPPRPPRSTLVPYTTLFRSPVAQVAAVSDAPIVLEQPPLHTLLPVVTPSWIDSLQQSRTLLGDNISQLLERLDRKSTRLNSSHVKISYAVFCLKKKNPEERR